MPVLMLIAIAVVLAGIFFVATGRGGELAYEQADHAPLDLGPVSAADIALLRPPSAMWGYNMQVTDAALDQIARAMRERDVTIAYLQDQLAGVQRNGAYTMPRGAHARPGSAPTPPDAFVPLEAPDPFEAPHPLEAREPFEAPERLDAPEDPGAAAEREAQEELADPGPLEPLEVHGSPPAAEPAAATPYRQTPLVLKASGPRLPAEPEREPHEITQPSEIPDVTPPSPTRDAATQPLEVRDPAEPAAALDPEAPGEVPGPQGAFDTHSWWAEQQEAAQRERARRQAAGEEDDAVTPHDDPLAAAEEQGW